MTATKVTREPTGVTTEATEPKSPTGVLRPLFGEAIETALHTYEQLVANLVEFEHRAAGSARSERAKAAINLHATFVEDLTSVYVRTARAALR